MSAIYINTEKLSFFTSLIQIYLDSKTQHGKNMTKLTTVAVFYIEYCTSYCETIIVRVGRIFAYFTHGKKTSFVLHCCFFVYNLKCVNSRF